MRRDLNGFVLELYHLTGSGPWDAFGAIAFALLEEMLAFDSALWGTFTLTPGGARAHSQYLHKLPARMMEEYEDLKQYDVLNQQSVAHCGTTLNVSLAQVESATHPAMIAHARRWGMEHTLATMILESPLNLYTAVCIYRNATRRPFSERDRRRIERIAPHLVQAWHLNAPHFPDNPPAPAPAVARVVIDRFECCTSRGGSRGAVSMRGTGLGGSERSRSNRSRDSARCVGVQGQRHRRIGAARSSR